MGAPFLFRKPPPAPDVALPKAPEPTWFDKTLAIIQGATGLPLTAPENYEQGGEQLDRYAAGGELASMLAGPLVAMSVLGKTATRIPNPIKAYHGSGADFDAFDAKYIGTGEGAQAYGYGHYGAGRETVAEGYRKAMSGKLPEGWAQKYPESARGYIRGMVADVADGSVTPQQAAKHIYNANASMRDYSPDQLATELSEAAQHVKGRMYELNLHVTPDELLDWDKPLSEQPKAVVEWLRESDIVPFGKKSIGWRSPNIPEGLWEKSLERHTGEELYRELERPRHWPSGAPRFIGHNKPVEASGRLHERGIKGIQYLDQGSRGHGVTWSKNRNQWAATGPAGKDYFDTKEAAQAWLDKQQTRNYVIFPGHEDLIEIAKKYGIPLATVQAAYAAYQRDQQTVPLSTLGGQE